MKGSDFYIDFQNPNLLQVTNDHGQMVRMVTPQKKGCRCILEFKFICIEEDEIRLFEQTDELYMVPHKFIKESFLSKNWVLLEERAGFLSGVPLWVFMRD